MASRSPSSLHTALWSAFQELAGPAPSPDVRLVRDAKVDNDSSNDCINDNASATLPTFFTQLDAALAGGGWPSRAVTELLLPHPGVGELRLLAPALASVQQAGHGLVWFDPPTEPCAWALGALGIDAAQLVVVRSRTLLKTRPSERLPAADLLWALEQTLKSGHAGAVLAWLPALLPPDAVRRLQLAAQHHPGPAFLLREMAARQQASAAPLRMVLSASGPDAVVLTVFKRRGPPLAQPLLLALPQVLPELALQTAAAMKSVNAMDAGMTPTAVQLSLQPQPSV